MARAGLGLALHRRMHTRRPLGFLIAVVLLAFVATPLTAADPAVTITHVRPMSPELQSLVDKGVERSPALRALVAKLEASNVIVYVNFREFPEKIVEGRLVFIGTTAHLRYLQIFIESSLPHEKHLSLLGHEFRHALEIAAEPSVVDSLSMGRYYGEIGWIGQLHSTKARGGAHRRLQSLPWNVKLNTRLVTNHMYGFLFLSGYLPVDSAHELPWV